MVNVRAKPLRAKFPDHTADQVTLPTSIGRREPRRLRAAGMAILAAALLAVACAPAPRPGTPASAGASANLSGFPPEFRQGYADGCASARGGRVRDEKRFAGEPQYASGWRDGFDVCGRR